MTSIRQKQSWLVLLPLFVIASVGARAQTGAWQCGPEHQGTDDGCDCGCSEPDPDCGPSPELDDCDYSHCSAGQVPATPDITDCVANVCGDGFRAGDERCDDGDALDGGGCSADCSQLEAGYLCGEGSAGCERERCGNGNRTASERCDDGNVDVGDGCDATCQDEPGFVCYSEQPCRRTSCGDGWAEFDPATGSGETCDDGNRTSGDGCSVLCELEPGFFCSPFQGGCIRATCGNSVVEGEPGAWAGETCDDGNSEAGDGCDAECHIEPGFACDWPGPCHVAVCGDGVIDFNGTTLFENCDDGNANSGDGCSDACVVEPGFDCWQAGPDTPCVAVVCGDGVVGQDQVNVFEACDDGNTQSGDGCDGSCAFVEFGFVCPARGGACREPECGDGAVDRREEFGVLEDCDDGNTDPGDGCDDACRLEPGFECLDPGQPCSELPDGWRCAEAFYGGGDGCDCGCGSLDPDCTAPGAAACTFNHCFDGSVVALDPCDATQCIRPDDVAARQATCPDDDGPTEGPDAEVTSKRVGCSTTDPTMVLAAALLLLLRRHRRG